MSDWPAENATRKFDSASEIGHVRPLFRARNLRIAYGARPALFVDAFDILPQRITAIVGPSGCGKTSFLQCLNRLSDLIPGCTVQGELGFDDCDLLAPQLDLIAHRRRVGMIFQKPNPFPLSIYRNLELPLSEHGMGQRNERRQVIEKTLRDVGLWEEVKHRLHAPAPSLSGGQQQRLCIARALVLSPEVLLMDEPCSALDPLASGVVEDLIAALRQRVSIVIVTHNLAQARRLADDAALFWLQDGCGRLVESSSAKKMFNNPSSPITAEYIRGARG